MEIGSNGRVALKGENMYQVKAYRRNIHKALHEHESYAANFASEHAARLYAYALPTNVSCSLIEVRKMNDNQEVLRLTCQSHICISPEFCQDQMCMKDAMPVDKRHRWVWFKSDYSGAAYIFDPYHCCNE